LAQNVDFPLIFVRADLVDNTKPKGWMYMSCPARTAVNGYFRDRDTGREAAIAKIAADLEANYKSAATLPNVFFSYTTQFQTGPNCEIMFASTTAGTAGSATTVAISADSASTAVNCSATVTGVVTIKVPAPW
jgi:hypothetical protein